MVKELAIRPKANPALTERSCRDSDTYRRIAGEWRKRVNAEDAANARLTTFSGCTHDH